MMEKKPDATEIEAFVGNLAVNLHLEPARSWWPDYLFHTTELHNVVEILKSGQLLSRAALGEKMRWDNANKEIIGQAPNEVREKVRLYFRPRTPMAFNNEGFRTIARRHRNAYCPLPVVIGFPSLPILTARETIFSGGNCSDKETRTGTTAAFFRSIPFADVYHDTTWPPGEVGIQLAHDCTARSPCATTSAPMASRHGFGIRCSPFDITPHKIQIRVRSAAELETLFDLLDPETVSRYSGVTTVSTKQHLFHKRWTYIESVVALGDQLIVRFNASTIDIDRFEIKMVFDMLDGMTGVTAMYHQPTRSLVDEAATASSGSESVSSPDRVRR